eukprot:490514-Rhodomonas_salina.1
MQSSGWLDSERTEAVCVRERKIVRCQGTVGDMEANQDCSQHTWQHDAINEGRLGLWSAEREADLSPGEEASHCNKSEEAAERCPFFHLSSASSIAALHAQSFNWRPLKCLAMRREVSVAGAKREGSCQTEGTSATQLA